MNNFIEGLQNSVAPVWDAPDEGGSGDGGDKGGTPPADWQAPEGLGADFVGANADESLGKLSAGYTELNTRFEGLRTKLADMPMAPKTPDEYVFEASENSKPWFGDVENNPIMPLARQAAHKHGLSNDQFNGFVNEVFGAAGEAGAILPPLDPAAEIKNYIGLTKGDEASANGDFLANETFAKGLRAQLKGLPEGEDIITEIDGLMLSLTDTAAGNILLSSLRTRLGDSGIRVAGQGESATGEFFAKEDLRKMAGDPRADPANKEFDRDFREKLDKSYSHHLK